MNMLPTRKYGVPLKEVEKKSLESEEYKLDYDFKRLKKSPLNVAEVVYVLSGRLKKKDAPSAFYKSTTVEKSFFNSNEIL